MDKHTTYTVPCPVCGQPIMHPYVVRIDPGMQAVLEVCESKECRLAAEKVGKMARMVKSQQIQQELRSWGQHYESIGRDNMRVALQERWL